MDQAVGLTALNGCFIDGIFFVANHLTCHSLFKKTLLFITPEGGFSPPDRALGPWFKTTGFQPYSLSVDGSVRQFLCHQLSSGGCLLCPWLQGGTAHQRASHI
jgi:hypothetical protein